MKEIKDPIQDVITGFNQLLNEAIVAYATLKILESCLEVFQFVGNLMIQGKVRGENAISTSNPI